MYTRILTEAPEFLIKNGKPVFGTFKKHPAKLDIRNVQSPFGIIPLPPFITNFRIKVRLSFFFDLGDYTGCIDFLDFKFLGYAEVCFWHKDTKQKFAYRSFMGPRLRFIPHNLESPASVISFKKSRYIKISWDRKHNKFTVIFNLAGDSVRPSVNGVITAPLENENSLEISSVQPAPTKRRCSADFSLSMPVRGTLSFTSNTQDSKVITNQNGCGLLNIKRIYSRFRSYGKVLCGTGFVDGKQIVFHIAETSQDAADSFQFNSNVLFYNGKVTPLPPVKITHSSGINKKWIIQDTENMIDLSFTPQAFNLRKNSIFILRSQYLTIYGNFEGVLLTADGEKINLRSLPGIAKQYIIRL